MYCLYCKGYHDDYCSKIVSDNHKANEESQRQNQAERDAPYTSAVESLKDVALPTLEPGEYLDFLNSNKVADPQSVKNDRDLMKNTEGYKTNGSHRTRVKKIRWHRDILPLVKQEARDLVIKSSLLLQMLLTFRGDVSTYQSAYRTNTDNRHWDRKDLNYSDMILRVQSNGDKSALKSLIANFNKHVCDNQKKNRYDMTVFPYTIKTKDGDETFQVPVPLTVELYLKLSIVISAKM
jgi:hypothetical protein